MLPPPNYALVPEVQPREVFSLGQIARANPRLAYTLLKGQVGEVDSGGNIWITGGWEVFDVPATWTSAAANQMIQGDTGGIVEVEMWILDVKYTVQRPNAFAGSVLKAQSDFYNSLNPNIDAQVIINSYCRYVISQQFTPIENLRERFDKCCFMPGIILSCSGSIEANFTNIRALAADEIPTIVTLTFSGIRLPPGLYGSCSYNPAIEFLRKEGILPRSE